MKQNNMLGWDNMDFTKPIVGILPTYNLVNKDNDPYQDRASFVRMYSDKIVEAGGIPIGLTEENVSLYFHLCDAYVWPGGSKIYKSFNLALQDAIKTHKPFLGVCLGAQGITTFFNVLEDKKEHPELSFSEIYETNKTERPYLFKLEDDKNHNHYVTKEKESIENAKHEVTISKDSFLYQIYHQEKINVPSLHSYCIARVPASLVVSAKSEDGIIEAVEYYENDNKILGVQFHPEILEDIRIFQWLILNARNKYQLLVNKENPLQGEPFSIINYHSEYDTPNPNLEEETFHAWLAFRDYVRQHGFYIDVESAYRSIKEQQKEMDSCIKNHGLEHAKRFVAEPGYSEHHTGLAIDICMKKDNEWINEWHPNLEECYQFLKENCAKFGFILRYPEGKENITGYGFEPWHFRYVGNQSLAKKIMDEHVTLEEYVESNKLCRKLPK